MDKISAEDFYKSFGRSENINMKVHSDYCEKCPSNHNKRHGFEDPESHDLKHGVPKECHIHCVFPCAWRPNKLCRGIVEYFDLLNTPASERHGE